MLCGGGSIISQGDVQMLACRFDEIYSKNPGTDILSPGIINMSPSDYMRNAPMRTRLAGLTPGVYEEQVDRAWLNIREESRSSPGEIRGLLRTGLRRCSNNSKSAIGAYLQ